MVRQKRLFLCRIIGPEYTIKNKLIVMRTLIEDASSSCRQINHFSRRSNVGGT